MQEMISLKIFIAVIVFSVVGLVIQALVWKIFDHFTPGNLWEEIIEKKNLPLAIVVGSVTLAGAQIIAAAIQG